MSVQGFTYGRRNRPIAVDHMDTEEVVFAPSAQKWIARYRFRPQANRGSMRTLAAFDTEQEARTFIDAYKKEHT